MRTVKIGVARLRRSAGTIIASGLMIASLGVLVWGIHRSPDRSSLAGTEAPDTEAPGIEGAAAEPSPPAPTTPPQPPAPTVPPQPALPEAPQPAAAADAARARLLFGPLTTHQQRETPLPATGTAIISARSDARSEGLVNLAAAVEAAVRSNPVDEAPAPKPVGPPLKLPPIPEVLPPIPDVKPPAPKLPPIRDALPPVPEADPAAKPSAVPGAEPAVKPEEKPEVRPDPLDGKLLPLPTGPAPLPPTPGGSAVPKPEAAPVPPLDAPAPGLAAPKPAPTLLITVPGVALPLPPPVLVPLPRPTPAAKAVPAATALAAPQEKLPEPRKLDIPQDAVIRLARARNAMKAGDLALAITEFEQYLVLVPADVAVRAELAGVYTQAEKFAAAAAAYQELIRLAPENTPLYLLPLSDLLGRMKDFRGAIAALRRAIDLTPDVPKNAPLRADAAARLARAHLFDEDLPSAFDVVQRFLSALKPGDEAVPIRYVSFLLDLERAKEAQPFLEPFVRALGDNPDPEVLVNNVRLYALLNDKRKAYDAIELLATKVPKNVGSRLQLAETLVAIEDYDLAVVVFGQISQLRPNHVPSQLAHVRMLLRQYRVTHAKALLETIRPVGVEQIVEASLVRGQYHLAAGQYTEAKYFYQDILRQFPFDPDARIGLGATHESSRDLEKAKAEYSKIPPGSRGWRRARRGVATVLAGQRKITQSLDVLTALQREAPWDHQTLLVYAQISTRNGYATQAVEACAAFLAGGSPTASAAAAVEGALGTSLLAANKVAEAEAAFRSALAASFNKSIIGHYGLMRVSQRLGGGLTDMGCPPEFVGDEIRFRLTVSDLFADDRDDHPAYQHAFTALRADPQNLAALVRVADLHQRLARESGNIEDAVATAKALLVVSPTNVRGHLALARSYSIARNFKGSAEVYQKLISLDSDYTLPKREVARIYYADYRYDLSHDTYLSIAAGDPESSLRTTLQTICDRAPGSSQAIQLILGSQADLPNLGPDLGRLATALPDPLVAQAIMAAMADYEARATEARGARLEDTAKGLRDLRNLSAVGAYRALIEQEPGNTDALFDLAQVYTTLRKTREANKIYGEVLAADPLNREAMIALERNRADLAPSFRPSIGIQDERGRNGVAQMQRTRFGGLISLPLGDADEIFGIGYNHVNYRPSDDGALNGDIATIVYQKKLPLYDQLLFRTRTNYEQYASRLGNRVTTDTGLLYAGDGYNLTAGVYVENVPVSGEALRQDIYRYGFQLGADHRVNRRVDVAGLYRYGYYSDSNNLHEFNLNSGYRVTPLPRQLRLLVNVQGLFYSDQTVFGPNAPFDLRGTIHPYFAPSSFTFYEGRLEWTHIVGRDLFGGANNLTYVAQYGLGWDNQAISYNRFRLDVTWDIKSWLSAGIAAEYLYSGVYRYGSAFGYLMFRLPHLYNL